MSDHPYLYPGSPAFPTTSDVNRAGLTKREHFAALALQGILAHEGRPADKFRLDWTRDAVAIADALVQALNEEDDDDE